MKKFRNKFIGRYLKILLFNIILLSILIVSNPRADVVSLSCSELPEYYFIDADFIFENSDSVFIGSKVLIKDVDYFYSKTLNRFDLRNIDCLDRDTITIQYDPAPSWLKKKYGESLPVISPDRLGDFQPFDYQPIKKAAYSNNSDIQVSGVKTFRFNGQSSGSTGFNQSLDLQLSGKLTKSLSLSGVISDRGYDPVYGTLNRRIDELDRIKLSLSSKKINARLGDIIVKNRTAFSSMNKKLSGIDMRYEDESYIFGATAARTKGRFESAALSGVDNRQGPYRINRQTSYQPIVPASESVWLDGQLLQSGANNDYIIDYPAGTITFNVNRPIDSRSRIEIDFEPLTSLYNGEYFQTQGGAVFGDSSVVLNLGWVRESDNKNQFKAVEYSESDKNLLAAAGDVESLIREGYSLDTLGKYDLIVDSLPDTVFQYSPDTTGAYRVNFNYVGTGRGEYSFLGNDEYRYVGALAGDYLPQVVLIPPRRTDYFISELKLSQQGFGQLDLKLLNNSYDRNLYSSLNDEDNSSNFYQLKYNNYFDNKNMYRIEILVNKKEKEFKSSRRLYHSDIAYNFMMPNSLFDSSDQTFYELNIAVTPFEFLSINPVYSRFDLTDKFESERYGTGIKITSSSLFSLENRFVKTESDLKTGGDSKKGKGNNYSVNFKTAKFRRIKFESGYEHDSRENNYYSTDNSTEYDKFRSALIHDYFNLSYELYREDSLVDNDLFETDRSRVTLNSTHQIGFLNYQFAVTYQSLSNPVIDDNSLLNRMNVSYNNPISKLNWSLAYALSEESRNSRGIRYFEVDPGEGDYILDDGQYISDPSGNFIRIEEILSDQSEVSRGLKSFSIMKSWKKLKVRFNSEIEEELTKEGSRSILWVLPFYSDSKEAYFYYFRKYNYDMKMLPFRGSYHINLDLDFSEENRTIATSSRNRREWSARLALKQSLNKFFIEQNTLLFNKNRDSYYNGGTGRSIKGYRFAIKVQYLTERNIWFVEPGYRNAKSASEEQSKLIFISLGSKLRMLKKGELENKLEIYSQDLKESGSVSSFILTDNHFGRKGVIWSTNFRYALKKGLKINLNINGRHSDIRRARITGRGELVAAF